jgi:pyruvate/2-oxoglutarate dehydrogenase complex dihydrolipoamide dehydrogenase (E3) component
VIVIGAGPIGLEMAQSLALFGSNVKVLLRGSKLLPKEDPDAAKIVQEALVEDGIDFCFNCGFDRVEHTPPTEAEEWPDIRFHVTRNGAQDVIACDMLLVATGRKPNVDGLGLELAGVAFDNKRGVHVDTNLRTSSPDIFAVGDVCTSMQFTHVSGAMAGIVVENALFGGKRKFEETLVPWCTFTEPEVAHTGLYESDFAERGIQCETWKVDFAHNDRAILESATVGFCKVHCRKGTDQILGGTIVAANAGDMISEITVAIQAKIGLGTLGRVIHPYPTIAEGIQGCGISYNRTLWKKLDTDGRILQPDSSERKPVTLGLWLLAAGGAVLVAMSLRKHLRP